MERPLGQWKNIIKRIYDGRHHMRDKNFHQYSYLLSNKLVSANFQDCVISILKHHKFDLGLVAQGFLNKINDLRKTMQRYVTFFSLKFLIEQAQKSHYLWSINR